jgi:hypothetical protein
VNPFRNCCCRADFNPPERNEFRYNLKFEYIVDALTAISGFVADDHQTIVRMIEKIRFAPPRKPKK